MFSLFHLGAVLLTRSAALGWINLRYVRLPHTIGLLAMGLLASLALALLGRLATVAGPARALRRRLGFGPGTATRPHPPYAAKGVRHRRPVAQPHDPGRQAGFGADRLTQPGLGRCLRLTASMHQRADAHQRRVGFHTVARAAGSAASP